MNEQEFEGYRQLMSPYEERVSYLISITFWLFFFALAGLSNYVFNDYKIALYVACVSAPLGALAGIRLVMAMIDRDRARGYGSTSKYYHGACIAVALIVWAYVLLK